MPNTSPTLKKLADAIAVLVEEIATLAARIEVLEGLIAQAKENIISFTERIANLTMSIADVDQKLKDDTEYYTTKATGLQELNVKLLLVNEKLGKMIGSSSGKNEASHIAKTASEKKRYCLQSSPKKRNLFHPTFQEHSPYFQLS